MERAAAQPDVASALVLSGTVTRVVVQEDPSASLTLTLMLEREPIEVLDGNAGEAESEIMISADDLVAFCRGELQLAMAIARGRVSYRGRVRKFLRASPILRRVARGMRGDE